MLAIKGIHKMFRQHACDIFIRNADLCMLM